MCKIGVLIFENFVESWLMGMMIMLKLFVKFFVLICVRLFKCMGFKLFLVL